MNTLEDALEMSETDNIPYLNEYEQWLNEKKNYKEEETVYQLQLLKEMYANEMQRNSEFHIEIIAALFSKNHSYLHLMSKIILENASPPKVATHLSKNLSYFHSIRESIMENDAQKRTFDEYFQFLEEQITEK